MAGQIEVDQSYFGPQRIRSKHGHAIGCKTIVFGLFKRNGRFYTKIVPDIRKRTLQGVIRGKVDFDCVIHSNECPGYHGFVDVGYAKFRLSKINGIRKEMFYLHLK